MFFRFIVVMFTLTFSFCGAATLDEMRAAVTANPALLDTPQAKAMMDEKGVKLSDVKSRLAKTQEMTRESVDEENIENKIDVGDISDASNVNKLVKRLNPFKYKTNDELIKEIQSKQQILTDVKLSRYSDAFYANKNMIDSSSLPTPDNYNISTGDVISVHVYGDRNSEYELKVSNDGSVELEFIGPVKIGGMSYLQAKEHLTSKLKQHFKMSSFKVKVSNYSSIQVTLIGDVKYPGIYNLSSFSSVKDLLVESKGVRENASLRDIVIKREGKTVASLDFYDLLFEGKDVNSVLLKHGDIVIIKKAKKLVSIDGYVNNTAIFELTNDENLDKLIEYAGGMRVDASKRHIKIDRYSDNSIFETFHVSYRKARKFKMKDGDKVYIYQLDDSADSSVNVYGNVIRPGSYHIGKGSDLTSMFKRNLAFGIKEFFLPETCFKYSIIKRYSNSLSYETITFNLADVISGAKKLELRAKDEVYIFSKNDIATSAYVTTKGSVLVTQGKLRHFDGMTISDAINASGMDGITDDRVRVTTINTPDRMPKTSFYSLKKDAKVTLSPYDEVEVYDYYATHLLEPISIKGEVVNPTTVFYEKGMTLEDLFNSCGGVTSMAYLNKLEIVRYYVDEQNNRQKKIVNLSLDDIDPSKYELEPYDEVTIYKIPNWSEKRVVTIGGEVKFPGTYTVSSGENLSSVIERAGGYTQEAFVEGAVFTRESIRVNQLNQYNQSLARVKRELELYNSMPANAKNAVASAGTGNTLKLVMEEAQKYQPIGRISVSLNKDLNKFKDSQFDLTLKDKDTLIIPSNIDTVTVFGEVFNPSSFVYDDGMNASDYITMASGLARSADDDNIYVIHADGTSEPVNSGWLFGSEVEIVKGDTIVVPIYIKENNILDISDSVARILSSFALTAAAFTSLGVL